MTNVPTLFSSIRLPANVTLLKNNGNNSMTACERLDKNGISTTRCNEVITCATQTDKHAHKNSHLYLDIEPVLGSRIRFFTEY